MATQGGKQGSMLTAITYSLAQDFNGRSQVGYRRLLQVVINPVYQDSYLLSRIFYASGYDPARSAMAG